MWRPTPADGSQRPTSRPRSPPSTRRRAQRGDDRPGAGARVITLLRFEPTAFLRALEQHRVTASLVAPPIMRLLAHHPTIGDHDLGVLRVVGSAGAPLPAKSAEARERRLGIAVCNAYGMTGTGWIALDSASEPRRPGTVGKPVDGLELRLVDPETARDVPGGAAGEVWVRSPAYLGEPAATAALITPDGWCRTGDLGVLDAHPQGHPRRGDPPAADRQDPPSAAPRRDLTRGAGGRPGA
ncbi:MAG TPA: AMP-binding protein [Actinomycetospora sp.]|uniref:AMP-binding protein n=1 Tax=Actinomycetospora sp. TaxID=1872135 RepID=UPI002F3E46DA